MARFVSHGVNAYPEYAQASAGGASFPVFAAINEPFGQTSPNARLQFGDQICDKFGNIYVYVRAVASLAVGQVVRSAYANEGDIPAAGTIAASTTTRRIFTTITTTLDEAGLGSFLASPGTSGGAGTAFFKPIKKQVAVGSNTTFDLSRLQIYFGVGKYDGDELSGTPATSDAVCLVRPYNVNVQGAVSSASSESSPVGVALGTVTAAGGTLIQTQGYCQVLGVGSTDAIVSGGPVVPAASGTVKGAINTATVAGVAEALSGVVGRSQIAWASTSHLIPVKLTLVDKL